MRIKYFATVFDDIKASSGWVRKMFLLGLLRFIPIFGPMIVQSYLYGWVRGAAYGAQTPLPRRVFGNEDGQLYRRAWNLFVVQLVYMLLPYLLIFIAVVFLYPWYLVSGVLEAIWYGDYLAFANADFLVLGHADTQDLLLRLVLFVVFLGAAALLAVILGVFNWAGSLRTSIYGSIKAGLQFREVFNMLKRDFMGILKILGMSFLVLFIASFAVGIVIGVLTIPFIMLLIAASLGVAQQGADSAEAIWGYFLNMTLAYAALSVVAYYLEFVAVMFVNTLTVRALGYWARSSLPDLGWPIGATPVASAVAAAAYPGASYSWQGAAPGDVSDGWQGAAQGDMSEQIGQEDGATGSSATE
jgi:hypothetical protein